MKKITVLLIVCLLLSLISACSRSRNEGMDSESTDEGSKETITSVNTENTSNAETTQTDTAEKLPDPEPFYSITPIKNGSTEYSIVYDSSDDDAEDFALSLADKLNNKYKIRIKCIAEYKSTDADKTISVGKSDGSLKKLAETMANKYDFAVKIEKDSLLLAWMVGKFFVLFVEEMINTVGK